MVSCLAVGKYLFRPMVWGKINARQIHDLLPDYVSRSDKLVRIVGGLSNMIKRNEHHLSARFYMHIIYLYGLYVCNAERFSFLHLRCYVIFRIWHLHRGFFVCT